MEDAEHRIVEKVQALSDIELAVLLSLITEQHCIIEAVPESLDALVHEIRLIAANTFGLTSAVLDCSEATTLDDFGTGILVQDGNEDGHKSAENGTIANIVVAKNLNTAISPVQVQALELMRGKRNYTRTAVHSAPKPFVFIALNASGSVRLSTHLNDQFCISHKHEEDHGLPNLEEVQDAEFVLEDDASMSSVVRSPPVLLKKRKKSILFSPEDLQELTSLVTEVKISSEVRAYLHNIIVFMRLHRAVRGGISAMATRHFTTLAHALAPLHGLSYITPSLVALAARKIYPHRIIITSPADERSMQWGSSLEAVKAVLDGVTVEDVIEEVLQSVEAPL
ncbi:hypothetical protein DM02DRAFT_586518 [Periconia macrospinosa]|uniref:magnesium chelatase n=1 Tax=Periconia macrospinosa TaxID=97972 RepID=A0A2V1E153_9PLEO|nr:hypothetical protein DM02DRAFT_586518 [Periconia macrospinosa]